MAFGVESVKKGTATWEMHVKIQRPGLYDYMFLKQ